MFKPRTDCIIDTDDFRFGYRASAVILKNDEILLMKNNRDPYLYTVGGAVCIGETSEEAVVREIFEETGMKCRIDRLVLICEDMWISDKGLPGHQLDFVYLAYAESCCKPQSGLYEEPMWIKISDLPSVNVCPEHIKHLDWSNPDLLPHIRMHHSRPSDKSPGNATINRNTDPRR